MTEKTVKIEKIVPFSIVHIFNGGTIDEVKEKLDAAYATLQPILDDGKYITFGVDTQTNDTYIKIWRMETDKECTNRLRRIERMAYAREVKNNKRNNSENDE